MRNAPDVRPLIQQSVRATFPRMNQRIPPVIDMTPDGRFRPEPQRSGLLRGTPLSFRIMVAAVAVAAVTLAAIVAVFALWLLALLIPVAAGAALIAYLSLKWRRWQRGRAAARPPVRSSFPG